MWTVAIHYAHSRILSLYVAHIILRGRRCLDTAEARVDAPMRQCVFAGSNHTRGVKEENEQKERQAYRCANLLIKEGDVSRNVCYPSFFTIR